MRRATLFMLVLLGGVAERPLAQVRAAAERAPDVVFVATPMEVVIGMLNLAGVADTDVVYDLGSGDGRIVIAAARHYGARAVGVDIDPVRVEEGRENADTAGVRDRVEFRQADFFETDLRGTTVVTLYLGRSLNERLRPLLLRDLRPGCRVVSQAFDMGDWEPDSVVLVRGRNFGETPVHLWVIPADVAGAWEVKVDGSAAGQLRLELAQKYQKVTGTATSAGHRLALTSARLRGDRLEFTVGARRFTGRVSHGKIDGSVKADGRSSPWRAARVGPP